MDEVLYKKYLIKIICENSKKSKYDYNLRIKNANWRIKKSKFRC